MGIPEEMLRRGVEAQEFQGEPRARERALPMFRIQMAFKARRLHEVPLADEDGKGKESED